MKASALTAMRMTSAVDGLQPELRQPDRIRALAMKPEEERAECRPDEGPRAAEDADPADDDRGDDLRACSRPPRSR